MKKIDKFIYYFTIVLMISLPFCKLLTYTFVNDFLNDINFIRVYILWFSIPILVISYIIKLIQRKDMDYGDIFTFILIILANISTIFALNTKTSFFGYQWRYEGLLTLLSYYLIFLNVKSIKEEKYIKNIIKVFIGLGIFQVLYSILQVYTNFSFIRHYSKGYMAMGLCSNPNFLGSYMVMLSLITLTLYLFKKETKYLFLTIIFFIGITLASSTGPFLGFVLTFILLIIVYHKKIDYKRVLLVILILISTYFIVDNSVKFVHENIFKNSIERSYNITYELKDTINNKDGISKIGNSRLTIWKNTLPLIKEYPIVGCGLDNFANAYPQSGNVIVDKAHNVYLQMIITNGIPALIAYCGLCLTIFIKGFKLKNELSIAIFMAFIGYSVQAFANISVIDVAPYFYLILGLLFSFIQKKETNI